MRIGAQSAVVTPSTNPVDRVASASASGGSWLSNGAETIAQWRPCTCRAMSRGLAASSPATARATPSAAVTRRRFSCALAS